MFLDYFNDDDLCFLHEWFQDAIEDSDDVTHRERYYFADKEVVDRLKLTDTGSKLLRFQNDLRNSKLSEVESVER